MRVNNGLTPQELEAYGISDVHDIVYNPSYDRSRSGAPGAIGAGKSASQKRSVSLEGDHSSDAAKRSGRHAEGAEKSAGT